MIHSQLIYVFLLLSLSLIFPFVLAKEKWYEQKKTHKLMKLDEQTYKRLALGGKKVNFEGILNPLLITRVSGTKTHATAKKYIIGFMKRLGWTIETDPFKDKTPLGTKRFENIIATLNPHVRRRLVLACHYDSMYTPKNDFIGATDSAVPCAMLLHMAQVMQGQFKKHKNSKGRSVSLQFIFFDGEEAFKSWSHEDSLYGARHLSAKWESELYPPRNSDRTTMLNRMDVMILLDLLGTKEIELISYFNETLHLYNVLGKTEQELKRSKYWSGKSSGKLIFLDKRANKKQAIEDDHLPFLQRGVDIVHLIPFKFPYVWHGPDDDKSALDFTTIENLNKILRIFVARYLHLLVQ